MNTLAIASAANVSGCSSALIRALVRRGILETAGEDEITVASLVRWLNERPDALRLPPRVRQPEIRTD